MHSFNRLWTILILALASVMLAACGGSGGGWSWWEILLALAGIIVAVIVIVLAVLWIGPEVVLGAIAELVEILIELISSALARLWAFLVETVWPWIVETAWPWIVRQARWIWSLLVRFWNWLRTVAGPWIWTQLTRLWTWFKGTRIGKFIIGLLVWGGSNPLWDAIKSFFSGLFGGGPPTLVYPPMALGCPASIVLTSTMVRSATENDYPFGMTAAAVAAAAATSATTAATAAVNADLAAQAAAIVCAGACTKFPGAVAIVSTATTPATKVSYLGGLYDSYTVTATVTATLTVTCR